MRRLIGLAPFAALIAAFYAAPLAPFHWAHTPTETCGWRTRPSLALLGPAQPDREGRAIQNACFQRRGLKSPKPVVKILMSKWPNAAQLATWNGEK